MLLNAIAFAYGYLKTTTITYRTRLYALKTSKINIFVLRRIFNAHYQKYLDALTSAMYSQSIYAIDSVNYKHQHFDIFIQKPLLSDLGQFNFSRDPCT